MAPADNGADRPRNIIILGAGRSGTSMAAGLFSRSGYFMGTHLYPGRDSNPKGFFEDPEINGVNEDILSGVQPDWAHPGQQWLTRLPLSTSFVSTPAIDQRIQRIVRLEPFCLKDPRFSYTFPVWAPHLKNTVCICVFRHPAATVQSILKECAKYYPALPMNRELALQAWTLMYQHILRLHRHRGEFVFVHYDQLFDADVQTRLELVTGAQLDRSFPERALRRSFPEFTPPAAVDSLYRNLCELAGSSPPDDAVLDADRVYEEALANAGSSNSDLQTAVSAFLCGHPDHARAHNDMGVILYQLGAKQEAVRHYERAVRLEPNTVTFLKNLADYYFVESQEGRKALRLYERVLALMPDDLETLINAGTLHMALRQPLKACRLLEQALLLDPENPHVRKMVDGIRPAAEALQPAAFESGRAPLSSRRNGGAPRGRSPHSKPPGKLVMTLLLRDEEDIVETNIEFHLSQGVDFIIATDNGSVDRTRDILSAYARQGRLLLIDEPSQDYAQAEWVNRMARLASGAYDADYIFHCDADEFWHARSGSLKTEIGRCKENVLIVPLVNVLLRSRSKQEHFPEDSVYAVTGPKPANDLESDSTRENLYLFNYPPKVIFATADGLFDVVQGNHNVVDNGFVQKAASEDIKIYHFPIRSYRHFRQKVINGGSSYERNLQLGRSIGFHWRRWFESYKKGTLAQEYHRLVIDDRQAEKLTRRGIVEPFHFSFLYKDGKASAGRRSADGVGPRRPSQAPTERAAASTAVSNGAPAQ